MEPRRRRTITCRASPAARKYPASPSPDRAPAPMPPPSPTPASSARACGRARKSSASSSISPSATSPWRRSPPWSDWPFACSIPSKLMGDRADLGITCALIPRDTPGVSIGRRHFPLNIPFQNGPIQGHDVFVPIDAIIGGFAMAGQGWRMLVEQLSVGRCISLPSNATGGAQAAVYASRGVRAHTPPVQHAHRPLRGHRAGAGAHGGAHLHHGRRALGHRRRDRRRREALGAVRHAEISRHRTRPHDRQRRHGRARRQGHLPGTQELSGARIPDRAGGHHGRRRQHPDAQPDHLRPGRGALPSLRAAGK